MSDETATAVLSLIVLVLGWAFYRAYRGSKSNKSSAPLSDESPEFSPDQEGQKASLSPAELRIEEEIKKLEAFGCATTVLVILGIFGLFAYVIPGIILFVCAALVHRSRKSKAVSLRAQLESLRLSKEKAEKVHSEHEERALSILKMRLAKGEITEAEYQEKKKLLEED